MNLLSSDNLQTWTSGHWLGGRFPEKINRLQFNSNAIESGDVFVALTVGKRDGHQFIEAAKAKGASAAIVSSKVESDLPQLLVTDTLKALQAVGRNCRNEFDCPVIAITGSYGKTSTKSLLSLIFGSDFFTTPGNLNNYIGVPLCLSQLDSDVYKGAVLETGINQKNEMNLLGEMIQPTQVICTGIGSVHLEKLGSLEGVAEEKTRLLRHLRDPHSASVYFPVDCLKYKEFQRVSAETVYVLVGPGESVPLDFPSEIFKQNYEQVLYQIAKSNDQNELILESDQLGKSSYRLPSMSYGMVRNTALAIIVSLVNGLNATTIQKRLNLWNPPSLRGERIKDGDKEYFVDCYNANPDSIRDSLTWFRALYPNQNRLIVLASMNELGPDSAKIHQTLMEELGLETNEQAIFVGEFARNYANGLKKVGVRAERYLAFSELPENEKWIEQWVGPVFLKGSRSYGLEKIIKQGVSITC